MNESPPTIVTVADRRQPSGFKCRLIFRLP